MGNGLGIAALILLLVSFPMPVAGNFLTLLALILAGFAGLGGGRTWAVAIAIVGGIKLFFMSPSWHILMFGSAYAPRGMAAPGAGDQGLNLVVLLVTLGCIGFPVFAAATGKNSTTASPDA